ncbi:hypothetical protein NUSPORA_02542 [Nucleospora cyclopteri]
MSLVLLMKNKNDQKSNLTVKKISKKNINNLERSNFHSLEKCVEIIKIIQEQRKHIKAPVDTMGCCIIPKIDDIITNFYSKEIPLEFIKAQISKFLILIKLLMSSQTKDEITHEALFKLYEEVYPFIPENIINKKEKISKCISKVGFCNKKTDYIIEIANKIISYDKNHMKSDFKLYRLLDITEEILKLKGVGNKMLLLYTEHALKIKQGIAVDVHVHRITNRLGIVKSKTPNETRKQLENIFYYEKNPSAIIHDIEDLNLILVGFGQTICKAKNPSCNKCNVNNNCRYFRES